MSPNLEKDIRESRGGDRFCCDARRSGRQRGTANRPRGREIATAH